MDDFDRKLERLSKLGFTKGIISLNDNRYTLTYVQVDELSFNELEEFISDITIVALKDFLKQDKDFTPYLNEIDDAIDSIEDINLYKLDKKYLDVSYVVLYRSIINLDEVFELCKNYKL